MPWCQHIPPIDGCRTCFLAKNDERYQKLWNINVDELNICSHLGSSTGESITVSTCCSGDIKEPLHNCAVFGTCTRNKKGAGVACCQGCTEKKPG